MSSTSGIAASNEAIASLNDFLKSTKRSIFFHIKEESCEPGVVIDGTSDYFGDFNLVREQLKQNEAVYFVHRLDDGKFLFAAFVPDHAPVRAKMLYASSANGLHQQFGGSDRFGDVVFWTELDEVSSKGWKDHLVHSNAKSPATQEEESLATALEHESTQMLGTSGVRHHLDTRSTGSSSPSAGGSQAGVKMKLHGNVAPAIEQLNASVEAALGLHIDLQKEEVYVGKDFVEIRSPIEIIDKSTPQYTVHKKEDFIVFIYTCPSGSKIKERMVYASNRQGVIDQLRSLGLTISKIVEATDGDDLTEDDYSQDNSSGQSPQQQQAPVSRQAFSRPKRPGRR